MARRRNKEKGELDPKVESVKKSIERAESAYHNKWSEECDARHDDFHAIVEEDWEEDDWHSHIFPPHIVPILEGMIAAMIEPSPHLTANPRPRPLEDIDAIDRRIAAAEVAEVAVNWAMENDGFRMKQRPFIQQDMICGLTVGKFYWEEQTQTEYSRTFYDSEEQDEFGEMQPVRAADVYSEEVKVRDDPTLRVVDVRDFFWPANCRDIVWADWLADRVYMTSKRVREMEEAGIFIKGSAAALEETSLPQQGKPGERTRYDEGGSGGPLRTRGLVEVIERWTKDGVCTIGNRQVLLRDEKNPFWHGRKPYVVTTAIPNFGQINGQSIVDVLAPIQKVLWFISNQSLDNLKLLNNLIYLIRSDTEDAHRFEWYPGAQWMVDDPNQVKALQIDPTPATISMQRESQLKGELQNLMGALPGTGNVDSQTIDQKTATGISIITNIAQQVIATRKMAYQNAFAEVGVAFLDLMRQFMLESRVVSMLGEGGKRVFFEVDPEALQDSFDVDYDVQGDSMVRQERRAESQSLYQMALQAAPIHAQFATPLNLDRFMEKLLKSFDEPNPKAYFNTKQQAQAQLAPPGGPGQPPGVGSPPGVPGQPPATPNDQGLVPPGMGPLGAQGNPVTAAPGPGVSTNGAQQQMLSQTGRQQ
jgi:hypothetical protein